ncbi:MAG: hypothetical protein M3O31_18260 [Acidobacteriota bacterium]|nr:hypothetical protein [Acidobacteriota bacterium]
MKSAFTTIICATLFALLTFPAWAQTVVRADIRQAFDRDSRYERDQRDADDADWSPNDAHEQREPRGIRKYITNVEELYSAVNNSANAGTTLVLARGTYMLSGSDPNNVPRLKGGRIELQPDMSLVGVRGDRDAVVISAHNLPASSFPATVNGVATGPNAAVRIGLGHNAVEWLTVRDAIFAQANIDSGLQPLDPGTTFIRVEHVASTGSTRGLNILNFGPQTSGQTIEADIVDCYFFDNDFGISEGVRMGNFAGATGSTVNVWMSGNRSWGQATGRLIVDNTAIASTVNVVSSRNRFYGNGAGTIIAGGLTGGTKRADGNTINFEAHGDEFIDNTGATAFDHGGLVVLGGENASPSGGGGSNNTVNVQLWDCRMLGNNTSDLTGIGGRSLPSGNPSLNQNNHVTIEIKDDGDERRRRQPVEIFTDSIPAVPDYGNSVTVN